MLLNSVNVKQIIDNACDPIYMRRENIERITKAVYSAIKEDRKEAIKDVLEKLKENAETMIYEVGALPHGDERYKFSYEAVTVRQIDELFTELYGAEE